MAELSVKYSREEINIKIPFMVIVENFKKRYTFSGRMKYLKSFTIEERKRIRKFYRLFYNWYLIKGVPEHHFFTAEDIQLIDRAGNFFGS